MGRGKVVLLVSAVVFISPIVAGEHFDVSVDVPNSIVEADGGEALLFNVTVENNGETEDEFTTHIWTANTWYNGPYPRTLYLDSGETGSSLIYVNPNEDAVAKRRGVEITVTSGEGENAVKRPSYYLQQDKDLLITAFDVDGETYDPGETVRVTASMKNVVNRDLDRNEYRAVFKLGDMTEQTGISSLSPGQSDTVSAEFTLGQFDYGRKRLVFELQDMEDRVHSERTARIRIAESERIERYQNREFNGVSDTRQVTAENLGNAPSEDTTVSASIPSYLSYFVSYDMDPAESTTRDGITTYTWNLGTLAPGDQQTVTYRINYWVPLAIIAVLLVTIAITIYEHRRPTITKKTFQKHGNHSVHLVVENNSGKIMDNVVVRDFVPGIASLVEKFDASPPEKIRKGEEGTELEWKLGRISPGEERILTYRVSPQVEVEGHVTLPVARLEYKTGNREKTRHSHHTTADFT